MSILAWKAAIDRSTKREAIGPGRIETTSMPLPGRATSCPVPRRRAGRTGASRALVARRSPERDVGSWVTVASPTVVKPASTGRGRRSRTTASTVVVNIDPAESDPTATTAGVFASRVRTSDVSAAPRVDEEAREREAQQRLWQIGLVAMLAMLAAESLVGRGMRPRRDAQSG